MQLKEKAIKKNPNKIMAHNYNLKLRHLHFNKNNTNKMYIQNILSHLQTNKNNNKMKICMIICNNWKINTKMPFEEVSRLK